MQLDASENAKEIFERDFIGYTCVEEEIYIGNRAETTTQWVTVRHCRGKRRYKGKAEGGERTKRGKRERGERTKRRKRERGERTKRGKRERGERTKRGKRERGERTPKGKTERGEGIYWVRKADACWANKTSDK